MSTLPTQYHPLAPSTSILLGSHYRLTILSSGLIRYEWSPDGKFEDRASTFAIDRNLPTPNFELIERNDRIEVITDRLQLEYDRKAFSPSGFSVILRENGTPERKREAGLMHEVGMQRSS